MAEEPVSKRRKTLKMALAVLLGLVFFMYLFGVALHYPLNDPDLWWHLKTGEKILETREIPSVDLFAYTTPRPLTTGQRIGLRSQWLGQVFYAAFQSAWGLTGVAIARNLLIILPMFMIYTWLVRRRLNPFEALAVIALPGLLLTIQLFYSFERPQGLSFSLVLLHIILLERMRRVTSGPDGKRFDFSMLLLPPLMALWSNVHAGFIVGNLITVIYVGGELLQGIWRKVRKKDYEGPNVAFFAICAVTFAASFINPNGPQLFFSYVKGLTSKFVKDFSHTITRTGGGAGWVENVVLEFKPLYYFYDVLLYKWLVFYWVFTGVLISSLLIKYWIKRKIDVAELVTVCFITFFANYYARGLMFSLTILPLYMGKTIVELKPYAGKFRIIGKVLVVALLVLAIGFGAFSYSGGADYLIKPGIAPFWITPWYPQALSNFIDTIELRGPMYNFYTWGGFLIWRLHPRYKVFIDGRALDNNISWTADAILKTFPAWQQKIEVFNINFIVIPVVFRESGDVIPLATALVRDDRWNLIFIRNNSALFVRNAERNRDLIKKYNIDKRRVFEEIIIVENVLIMGNPNNPLYYSSMGDALVALGRHAEAKNVYSRYPNYNAAQLQRIKQMGY